MYSWKRCDLIYKVSMHRSYTEWAEPAELEFVSTILSSADEKEVSYGKIGRENVGCLIMR